MLHELSFTTNNKIELMDITHEIEEFVKESGVEEGRLLIFVPHATAAVIVNEHESGLLNDYVKWLKKTFYTGGWEHDLIDNNAAAHLASAFIGCSRTLPVREARIVRGTWQNIFLVELDGPRKNRKVVLQTIKKV
ncbi:MAG: YjbQ family protein [Nanoarchaeota archaeon]|nr:YjbQ family protein [Nanoarchaeota archaeon]